jgi:DNA-directed RNA polymerase specialized sigma subunit
MAPQNPMIHNESRKNMNEQHYIVAYQNGDASSAEILINKYIALIRKLAHNHTKRYSFTEFEDNLQNAKYGALLGFKRFNLNTNVKLSTFLHTTIYHYLLSCNDEEAFVKCPSNLREVRNYISGKYSNDKKQNFEEKYAIHTFHEAESMRLKFKSLLGDFIFTSDDEKLLNRCTIEINFYDYADASTFVSSLSNSQQEIVHNLLEGKSMNKIREKLDFSKKQFSTEINTIKNKFVQYYYEC